jgi:general transcription factor 3C polypeptide 3 (transcription factor C subunit 4)
MLGALDYYLRAYELCPTDPMICLSTGVAYLHRAMQRQTDNRHHQIAQGFTLMAQYRKHRGPCQEVEYNFGRAFHMLGPSSFQVADYPLIIEQVCMDWPSSIIKTFSEWKRI